MSKSQTTAPWIDLLDEPLRFGAACAAAAITLTSYGVAGQNYFQLGWGFTIVEVLRQSCLTAAMVGAVGALAVTTLRDLLANRVPRLRRPLLDPRMRAKTAPRAIVAFVLGGLAAAAFGQWRVIDEGSLHPASVPWAAAVGVGTAAGVFAAGFLAPRKASALLWATLFALVWTALNTGPNRRSDLAAGEWGSVAAGALAAILILAVLASPSPRTWGLVRWLAAPGLPLVVTMLLVVAPLVVSPSVPVENPRSVVMIAVDTMRVDRTSLSPADARAGSMTPALAEFAAGSTVFTEATSQAPWTLPAFASILTGLYPPQHGAISLQGLLRPGERTLAEVLREAGYQTAGVVSHVFLDRRRGMHQGFSHFDESNIRTEADVTGEGVTDDALAWLAERDQSPFFLFVHYFDAHYEYRDHPEWNFANSARASAEFRGLDITDLRGRLSRLRGEDVRLLRDLYDEDVAFTDRAIGRLIRAIPGDVAVVLVGDHGEELLERDWLGHTRSLRREVTRVPLVMRLPGVTQSGTRVETPVETRAVYDTLLDYLGITSVGPTDDSLLPLLAGGDPPHEVLFSEVWLPDQPAASGKRVRRSLARKGEWLLIRDHDSGKDQLFRVDPDRGVERPAESARHQEALAAELDEWSARMENHRRGAPVRDLSDEERRQLKALGYL